MLAGKHFLINGAKVLLSSLLLTGIFVAIPGETLASKAQGETASYQANLGAYYWQKGDLHQAIEAWSKEAEIYRLQGLTEKEAEAIMKIAQSYTSLGQLRLAIFQLKKILPSIKQPLLIARTWEKLGNAHSRSGEFDEATLAYQKSLEIESNLSTLNNLVILLQKRKSQAQLQAKSARKGQETQLYLAEAYSYQTEAIEYAQEALSLSQTEESSSAVRALIEWGKVSSVGLSNEQIERVRELFAKLPSSRTKVFLIINWAKLDSAQTKYWFSQAQEIAENLSDAGAESFALLELGFLAEKSGDLEQALKYAYAAQLKAQSRFAFGSLYRAQWLTGRIYQQIGNKKAAITNYREAIASLDAFNQGFTDINVERRLDFQSQIEPIYRGMLQLLLEDSNLGQANLQEVLFIFDKLRLAQLQQYFGDNCFEIEGGSLPVGDILTRKNAVLLYSIILDDQTHLILQLPDGTLRHTRAELGQAEIAKSADDWYASLRDTLHLELYLQGQYFYNLIMRPFSRELEQINPSTIVFVHDGVLRNLPMSALYDGEKEEFLAQKWASVSSIGLNFKSKDNQEQESAVLAFGLEVAREGWSELDKVSEEVEKAIATLGGQKFLDRDFTTAQLVKELNQSEYSVLHLATHGYFGGVAENSFILAYDKPINALELENNLYQSKSPIDLLVLSACETAISSERSALGLAGVALRSGVASVLGSYWRVQDDEQLELMNSFYSNFQDPTLSLAEVIQQVQIEQIQNREHPSKWAALNLLGDW